MLKKAVPQVKHEYENQKRKLASNRHLAKKGKKEIGVERFNKKRDNILNDSSLTNDQKAALLEKLQKKEDGYKKQAEDHIEGSSWTENNFANQYINYFSAKFFMPKLNSYEICSLVSIERRQKGVKNFEERFSKMMQIYQCQNCQYLICSKKNKAVV